MRVSLQKTQETNYVSEWLGFPGCRTDNGRALLARLAAKNLGTLGKRRDTVRKREAVNTKTGSAEPKLAMSTP